MDSYRFSTVISDVGVITLPPIPDLHNMEAEVLIIPKRRKSQTEKTKHKIYSATDFLNEFSGIITGMEQITDEELDLLKQEQ
ncbi:MAG: hypothetical protein LBE36_05175 [Flavobacteriaceae bacterium]|nr:hypothetical protein [Flavobacteriaceae bacterium]